MSPKIVADECVDFRIIEHLRAAGFEVISVREECPSLPDQQVLEFVKSAQAILLTEDRDFGRWVFAHKQKDVGVIFLRYPVSDLDAIIRSLLRVLSTYQTALARKFVVIKANKIRIRDV